MFNTVFTDNQGGMYGEPGTSALARSGMDILNMEGEDLIPLPPGASLMMLPGRHPLYELKKKNKTKRCILREVEGEPVFAGAGILPPGYTRTLMPACENDRKAPVLPFFAYTALGWKNEELYCAAIKTHEDLRWNYSMYNSLELPKKIKLKKKKHPDNRLLKHLENCSLRYGCFTAQNIFYQRWEGGIPTASACNARCMGCISEKRIDRVDSPQQRISFIPTAEEITEIGVPHLETEGGIISFGQGCEGEPLTRGELILNAVESIRSQTSSGTINMNTNGSMPEILAKILDAGMDSVRISLNSAIEDSYMTYFQPAGYGFEDVARSIELVRERGKFLSLNYLYMPGVNDRESEAEAFFRLLEKHPPDMIQFRNLNIDPDYYFSVMKSPPGKATGTRRLIEMIKNEFPKIRIGNFSIPIR